MENVVINTMDFYSSVGREQNDKLCRQRRDGIEKQSPSESFRLGKPNSTCILMYVTLSFKSLDFCVYLRVALEARKLERGHWGGVRKISPEKDIRT